MDEKTYTLEQALKAQQALRSLAGLAPETFPLPALVGMISDEVQTLRNQGMADDQIAAAIRARTSIEITAAELARFYAPPEQRHGSGSD